MFVIILITLWQNSVWDIMSRHSYFDREHIQILRHVHREVTNQNPWCIFIGQLVVCNPKPIFYYYVVPFCLRNVVVWILVINFYSHIIAHFIHNLFKIAVTFNAFNRKYWFVIMFHWIVPSQDVLYALILWYVSKTIYLL